MELVKVVARASRAHARSLSPVASAVAVGAELHAQVVLRGAETDREGNDHGEIPYHKLQTTS